MSLPANELVKLGGTVRVFILGAGASHHAGYPLSKHLGAALKAWTETNRAGEKHRSVITQLEECGDLSNIEELLTSIVAERGVDSPFNVKEAICDFFWCLRSEHAPGYSAFAKNHVKADDVILTFNYDLALERQLKLSGNWEVGTGYGFLIDEKIAPTSKVKVLKMHGSVNWHGLLFGGLTHGFSGWSDGSLGARPVIWPRELQFLGYPEEILDPQCPSKGAFENDFILPTYSKEFYVKTSFGKERVEFWNSIWKHAEHALREADEVLILGYSLPQADERAVRMILESPRKNARILIGCGTDSFNIEKRFRDRGFGHVITTQMKFEEWSQTTDR